MSKYLPLICGIAGTQLSNEEVSFIKDFAPWGIILFERNCENKEQIKKLTNDLRDISHDHLPILIDQEGGRVSRLNYPGSIRFESARKFGEILDKDIKLGLNLLSLNATLLAITLKDLGININTIPVLDVLSIGGHEIIGDRAYSDKKEVVSEAGRIVIESLSNNGVAPVMKHIPGHGRAAVDSHFDLPLVESKSNELENNDLYPFLKNKNIDLAITAHIIYKAYDPEQPATLSKKVISNVIRNNIGFKGLLITDDISMKAIKIPLEDAAVRALECGCNLVLHCNGNMSELKSIARNIKEKFELIQIPRRLSDIFDVKTDIQTDELKRKLKKAMEVLE